MGLLSMNIQEHILHEKYIAESTRLHGYKAQLYQIDHTQSDIYNDPTIVYKDPVPIFIFFDDNPRPNLKKLGWLLENEATPYLATITNYQDPDLSPNDLIHRITIQKYCKIELEAFTTVDTDNYIKEFMVSEVRGNQVDPIYWTCKLTPWREPHDFNPETKDIIDKTIDSSPNNSTGRSYINKEI